MTAYEDELQKLSRRTCSLLVIRGHRCANVFSSAPCTANLAAGSAQLMLNAFFADWTTDDPDDFAISTEDANNYVSEHVYAETLLSVAQFESDGTGQIWASQSNLIAGLPYRYKIVVDDITSGAINFEQDSTSVANFSAAGTYEGTFTATGTDARLGSTAAGTIGAGLVSSFEIWREVVGSECYNTWATCKDRLNYVDEEYDLKLSSYNAALPFNARPYLKTVSALPTVIQQKISSKARKTYTLMDEEDGDIGVDPYHLTRTSIRGTYWKKFLARNPNYAGWAVEELAGFVGLDEGDFEPRWAGKLENLTISRGEVKLEAVDTMAALTKVQLPEKIKTSLQAGITDAQTDIVLSSLLKEDGDQIDASGYIQIGDEIVYYDSLTPASNQLNDCLRGQFGTVAAAADAGTRVTLVKYFAPANPFDLLEDLWEIAGGIVANDFRTAAWTYWKTWPVTDVDFSAIITEGDKITASVAFWEIADLIDCHIWQDEEQKISIRRNQGNEPDRVYLDLTDDGHVVNLSGSGDYNEKARRTRVLLYWGKTALGEFEKVRSYDEIDGGIDGDYEAPEAYGEPRTETILSRWFSKRYLQEEIVEQYAAGLVARRLMHRMDPRPIIGISVERKDEGLKTGDSVRMATDEFLNPDGTDIAGAFLIISRQEKRNNVELKLLQLPTQRICYIAPDATRDYDDPLTTDAEREYGFICDDSGRMPNSDPGYNNY